MSREGEELLRTVLRGEAWRKEAREEVVRVAKENTKIVGGGKGTVRIQVDQEKVHETVRALKEQMWRNMRKSLDRG